MEKYRFLEHTADVKFEAFGASLGKVFVNSALALKETITGKIKIKSRIRKKIKVQGKDKEALLYNFLEEFLFLLDSEDFLLAGIEKIDIKEEREKFRLEAEVFGDLASNYKFTNDVKAVTYNQMQVKKDKSCWICQVVLDV